MAMAALSPNSVLATPFEVNPQVKSDLQTSASKVAQEALKVSKTAQTDTVTISAQALKMADDKNALAKRSADEADRQKAMRDSKDTAKNETQKNAVKAYTAATSNE